MSNHAIWTPARVVEQLRWIWANAGETPYFKCCRDGTYDALALYTKSLRGFPSQAVKHYGSWNLAILAADLTPRPVGRPRKSVSS